MSFCDAVTVRAICSAQAEKTSVPSAIFSQYVYNGGRLSGRFFGRKKCCITNIGMDCEPQFWIKFVDPLTRMEPSGNRDLTDGFDLLLLALGKSQNMPAVAVPQCTPY